MNLSNILKIATALTLSLQAIHAQQNDAFADNGPQPKPKPTPVHIYHELIEITALQYAEIMTDKASLKNHAALRTKLIEQVKQDKAKLISNDSIIVRPNYRGTSISAQELIYESELEPDDMRIKNREIDETNTPVTYPHYFTVPPTPIAFEFRYVGDTLEVSPSLAENNQTIKLKYTPEHTRHTGNDTYMKWTTEAVKTEKSHPKFYTTRTNTELQLLNGQFTLVTSYSPDLNGKIDNTRKWLCFVRASILTVE